MSKDSQVWVYHMSVIPQPSLHLVARKKAKAAVMGIGGNDSALAPPTRPPGGGAGYNSGSSASLRSEAGPGPNQMHTCSVFLSGSEYIQKETQVREETKCSGYG